MTTPEEDQPAKSEVEEDQPAKSEGDANRPTEATDWARDADPAAVARGALYDLLAAAFDDPSPRLHAALADGSFARECERLVDRAGLAVDGRQAAAADGRTGETGSVDADGSAGDEPIDVPALRTDDDHDTLSARYNDLFVVGFSEVVDPTDGTIRSTGPPVPPYESAYRTEASWTDVNLDLARAYDYFGLTVDDDGRENHDHLRLQLAFAAYLCRVEAAVDDAAAAARLDFLDRHLRVLAEGVAERIAAEPGTGVYGDLAALLVDLVAADTAALARDTGAAGAPGPGSDDPAGSDGPAGADGRGSS